MQRVAVERAGVGQFAIRDGSAQESSPDHHRSGGSFSERRKTPGELPMAYLIESPPLLASARATGAKHPRIAGG
jgi:hypothetical protein